MGLWDEVGFYFDFIDFDQLGACHSGSAGLAYPTVVSAVRLERELSAGNTFGFGFKDEGRAAGAVDTPDRMFGNMKGFAARENGRNCEKRESKMVRKSLH